MQDDDGILPAAELDEPFLPDGPQAGPLPHKQEPAADAGYGSFPPSSGPSSQQPHPPANKGVGCLAWYVMSC